MTYYANCKGQLVEKKNNNPITTVCKYVNRYLKTYFMKSLSDFDFKQTLEDKGQSR